MDREIIESVAREKRFRMVPGKGELNMKWNRVPLQVRDMEAGGGLLSRESQRRNGHTG